MASLKRKTFGVVLIVLGLVILFTPFTPGSIILLIGIDMIFGDKWKWWQEKREKFLKFLDVKIK